jgi:hypothetical protein
MPPLPPLLPLLPLKGNVSTSLYWLIQIDTCN